MIKVHMFAVTSSSSELYKKSDNYKPGNRAVIKAKRLLAPWV